MGQVAPEVVPAQLPPPPAEQPVDVPEDLHRLSPPLEQTTLLQNEEESFALAPVDASALRGEYY